MLLTRINKKTVLSQENCAMQRVLPTRYYSSSVYSIYVTA